MIFTTFPDKRGLRAYTENATPEELAEFIRSTVREVRDKLPMIKGALFGDRRTDKGCLRSDENVTEITGLEADYDGGEVSFETAVEIARQAGLNCIIYTSPSYTVEKPRWRVLAPLSKAYRPEYRDRFFARLAGLYAQHEVAFDPASWTLSQAYFVGRANGGAVPLVEIVDGRHVDELDALDEGAIAKPNGIYASSTPGIGGPFDEQALIDAIVAGENYHRASLSLLGRWASAGVGMLEARNRLTAAFESVFPPERDQRWRDRVAEIPKLLEYVYGKQADKLDGQVEFTIGGRADREKGEKDEAPEAEGAADPDEDKPTSASAAEDWPEPLGLAAYHGIAGEVVMAIGPHTESDSAAILFQFLAAAGNAFGRRAYFLVEDTRHHANLFVVLVGKTAKARKGTSWRRVRRLFEGDDWCLHCITRGLSTGEGLVHRVRDATFDKSDPNKLVDAGVDDKRLLAFGEEFARTLRVIQRQENTLGQILCEAWDGEQLEVATKYSPEKATGAHVSVITHVTREDLYENMDMVSTANGFGNRFLYCCTRRSKLLPLGGKLNRQATAGLAGRIKEAIDDCPSGEIPFDAAAERLWCEQYEQLSAERLGMYGGTTSRGDAQTRRLALIYALLDRAQFVEGAHLEAALEVWRYADASARVVFGDKIGDRVADTILAALRRAGEAGMTRSEVYKLYNGRIPAGRIDTALAKLAARKLARNTQQATGGWPADRWFV